MESIIYIFLFIIFLKLFLFWLWLWQLKEYHLGRFLAHFEKQKFKKIISSFWRIKYPKATKKIIVIFLSGVFLALFSFLLFSPVILILLAPLFSSLLILFFQIPTIVWQKIVINQATKKRNKFKNLLVIAITGSYGKTSTKEFLAAILSEKFASNKILKTKANYNSEIGISRSILKELDAEKEIFIVELGAYIKGGIKLLCHIVKPQIGIITGVNEQHLSTFGSMKNLLSAEGGEELIESLHLSQAKVFFQGKAFSSMAFFNAKNKYCKELYQKTNIKKFFYGKEALYAGEENILGAIAVAKELGLSRQEIEAALNKIDNKFPGIKIRKGANSLIVVDATYSANPDGVLAHLEYLSHQFPQSKRIIVMPCLIELGKASSAVHRKIGERIAQLFDLAIITTKDRFREIEQGAKEKAILIEKPKDILFKINNFCRENDLILLEGRVPEKIIKQLMS